ncbi:MAG: NMD3-related protein [Methanobacteriota archaeon]
MFCPKCGRKGGGICLKCLLEENPVRIHKKGIAVCGCGRIKHKNKWIKDLLEMLTPLTVKIVEFPDGVEVGEVEVNPKKVGKNVEWDAEFHISFNGEEAVEAISLSTPRIDQTCPSCKKGSSGYYEAVLQIRQKPPPILPDINEVSNVSESKNGVDFQLKSSSYAKQMAAKYRKSGFIVNESKKTFGQKDGLEIYRIYYSVKPFPFKAGDVIEHKSKTYQITSIGANTGLIEVSNNQWKKVPLKDLFDAVLVAGKKELKHVLVSNVTPIGVQAVDTSTGRLFDFRSNPGFNEGDECLLLEHKGKSFLLKEV